MRGERHRRARGTLVNYRRRVHNWPHVVPAARERADEQLRNVGVERGTRRRFNQARKLAVVVRGAEPAPIAQHVGVDPIAE